jgi:hypothetical protein
MTTADEIEITVHVDHDGYFMLKLSNGAILQLRDLCGSGSDCELTFITGPLPTNLLCGCPLKPCTVKVRKVPLS